VKIPHLTEAEKIQVVLDNLNTHSPAEFYKAFPPQQARYLNKKLGFHYTPEHSSWLNMAEVENIILDLWKYDVKLVLDKHFVLVYYLYNTLDH
jgi:hypothetical protein